MSGFGIYKFQSGCTENPPSYAHVIAKRNCSSIVLQQNPLLVQSCNNLLASHARARERARWVVFGLLMFIQGMYRLVISLRSFFETGNS